MSNSIAPHSVILVVNASVREISPEGCIGKPIHENRDGKHELFRLDFSGLDEAKAGLTAFFDLLRQKGFSSQP